VGLVPLTVDRLFQVADAGSLGGGICFAGSRSAPVERCDLELLRFLVRVILLKREEPETLLLSGSEGVDN
jgi:hypothetical protein